MPAHPLALELIEKLKGRARARVLDLGAGRGRNTTALRQAGLEVAVLDDRASTSGATIGSTEKSFDAVLATHALLHGTPQSVAERVDAIARVLVPGGLFYATFASTHDARYGSGDRVTDDTFAPTDGDEAGVPHVYYDEARLRAILVPRFVVESLEERGVDDVAGTWAHPKTPLRGAIHWFARARVPIARL